VSHPKLRFEPESHRAIIDEAYLHIGSEYAGFNRGEPTLARLHELLEIGGAFLGRRGFREAGSCALPGVCGERELGHQQQAACFVLNATVHAAFGVREDPVSKDALRESRNISLAVVTMNGDQYQQASIDPTDDSTLDTDVGPAYSLQQSYHFDLISRNLALFRPLLTHQAE
jgi:hypothetical protein